MTNTRNLADDVDDAALIRQIQLLGRDQGSPAIAANVLTTVRLADRYFRLPTVAGDVYIAYNDRGVSCVERTEVDDFEAEFRRRFNRPAFRTGDPPSMLLRQIRSKLHGGPVRRLRYDLRAVTDFERGVLLKALEIPYGQIRPYSWIAREIGRPQAQRAVGSALAGNPIPLLIPCHRVVRSDGLIGNYGLGGPAMKRHVLEAEGLNPSQLEQLARAHVRYVGSDTTHIFCFPTCGHAKRVTDRHRVGFTSARAAREQGYRPCKVCRPEE